MKNQKSRKYAFAFLFLVAIISVKTLQAQSEFGLKGGALYTGINKNIQSNVFDYEMRGGVTFGAFYKIHNLLGPIGLQAELLYQYKGGNLYIEQICTADANNDGFPDYYGYYDKYSRPWLRKPALYHYLTLPVLITWSPVKFMDIYAGPEIGYMIANSSKGYPAWEPNRFSAGISAGVAFKIDENTKLDVRYSNDLTKLQDFGDTDIKNYGWAFTVQRTLFRKPAK